MFLRLACLFLPAYFFTLAPTAAQELRGEASYYADKFHGRPTSTGEKYDKNDFTAANKDFPVGSILRVTRADNGRSVDVRVNDCGPHRKGRIVDLSRAAAEKIGLIRDGVALVELKLIQLGDQGFPCRDGSRLSVKPVDTNLTSGAQEEPEPKAVSESIPIVNYESIPPAQPDQSSTRYWVQFGAYKRVENARTQYPIIQESGLENLRIVKDGSIHRLVAGPYADRFSAEALQYYLEKEKKLKGVVSSF